VPAHNRGRRPPWLRIPRHRHPDRPPSGRGSVGFVDALVIGLNATSPAYSLAAVIGPIVALVGVAAPGVLLAWFVPMLLIASAFYHQHPSSGAGSDPRSGGVELGVRFVEGGAFLRQVRCRRLLST
jgi:hypothetical protein